MFSSHQQERSQEKAVFIIWVGWTCTRKRVKHSFRFDWRNLPDLVYLQCHTHSLGARGTVHLFCLFGWFHVVVMRSLQNFVWLLNNDK